jgi:hypothetical protein
MKPEANQADIKVQINKLKAGIMECIQEGEERTKAYELLNRYINNGMFDDPVKALQLILEDYKRRVEHSGEFLNTEALHRTLDIRVGEPVSEGVLGAKDGSFVAEALRYERGPNN